MATPGNPLRYNTHRSAPPVSALAHWDFLSLRVEFLLKTDSGYPKDTFFLGFRTRHNVTNVLDSPDTRHTSTNV